MGFMKNLYLLQHFLENSADEVPNKTALICGSERLTYKEINEAANRVAMALINWGLKRQDRVIIFLENSSELVIAIYGVLKAGGVFVVLNPSIKANKLRFILQDSEAAFLITNTEKKEIVLKACGGLGDQCKIIWIGGDSSKNISEKSLSWDSIMEFSRGAYVATSTIDVDLAALIYTSGSTGEPKGVMSTHANMVSVTRSIVQYLKVNSSDIILDVLPLSFDYGLYQVLMGFMAGATVVLDKSFVFPVKILETIEREKVTGFPIVPMIAALILGLQNLKNYNLHSLRYISNTAAVLSVEHIRRLRSLLPWIEIYSMYGLTECKRVAFLPPEEIDRRPGSVGKAIPNCEVLIVNEEGREVGPGEVGELIVRGSNVMQGYWKAKDLAEEVFKPGRYPGERFLYSGDLFKKDEEGFLYFVGRKDDMIKTRGERVSPREVENVLCAMPGVLEAAVIGIPDEILGQAIKAFVVLENGASISQKEIMKYCTNHLESFMVPKYLEILPELPRTPNGKIDKKALSRRG